VKVSEEGLTRRTGSVTVSETETVVVWAPVTPGVMEMLPV
jgi:hypothetical protein